MRINADADTPVSVVHVIGHLEIGGGEVFLLKLAQALANSGLKQHVFCVGRCGQLAPEFARYGVPVTVFAKSSKAGLVTIARMARELRHLKPALVHTHGEGGLFWGVPAGCLARVTVASLVYQNYRESMAKVFAARVALRYPRAVIAGSRDVRRYCVEALGVPEGRVETIPCGIAPCEFTPRSSTAIGARPRVVSVGRLVARKGHRVLIDAFRQVVVRFPTAELHLIGAGPERVALHHQALALGVLPNVRFHDTIYPTGSILLEADVFAFPSLVEPQGLAVLEAFAAHVPVVASRTGGIVDMIDDNCEGVLVPPGDPDALAAALLRMLRDGALRARIVNRAHARLREFDVVSIAGRFLTVYERVAPGVATAAAS